MPLNKRQLSSTKPDPIHISSCLFFSWMGEMWVLCSLSCFSTVIVGSTDVVKYEISPQILKLKEAALELCYIWENQGTWQRNLSLSACTVQDVLYIWAWNCVPAYLNAEHVHVCSANYVRKLMTKIWIFSYF